MNISCVSDNKTARTNVESASQRADNLFVLGVTNVLELCVGPSLATLEAEYKKYSIKCTGNDIDSRWKRYYPQGRWIIGDCFSIDYSGFDAIIFAPPLSKGCTGKREDSLSVMDVYPRYTDFLQKAKNKILCLTLPGRTMATKNDRDQFYKLVSSIIEYELVPLTKNGLVKYWDLYIIRD
jgi:hypothetical protein